MGGAGVCYKGKYKNLDRAVLGNEEILERLPQYIILNLAVGGNWPGSPDENTPFPSQYLVDWVRVYQQ